MEIQVPQTTAAKISMAIIAAIGWFGLIVQYVINTGTAANFFSFFTVECNLLIVILFTILLVAPNSTAGKYFSTAPFQTAVALYIVVVGIVYNTVLRGLVPLEGMGLVVDTILHVVMPALYYIYWYIFVPKKSLQWKHGLPWMWFPALYLVYSLIRGAIIHWYPYPFLNAEKFGYPKVLVNVVVMIVLFFLGALIMIAIKRDGKSRFAA